MLIKKILNNNVVITINDDHEEIIVMGKGIAYGKRNGDLIDISKVNKTFELSLKDEQKKMLNMLKDIPIEYMDTSDQIIQKAKKELKGFEKVELEPEEEKEVMIKISKDELAYYDVNQNKWNIEKGTYNIYVGKNVEDIVLKANLEIDGTTINKEFPSIYMTGNIEDVSDTDFEEILGHKIPTRYIDLKDLTVENTLEQFKNTKIGKKIFDHEMEKMDKLMKEQNVNKATKVMMDLQKPLKKFYEKKSSKYTKEMVEEFINTAKKDEENFDLDFVKLYLK